MALIVEDGTIVADANSYNDLAGVRSYASARGVVLSADDAVLEPQVIKAMDFIEGYRAKFQGTKTDATQALQWPRTGVTIDCIDLDANTIPNELKSVLGQLCVEIHNGIELTPTQSGAFVVAESVGPISTKYSEKLAIGSDGKPTMPAVESLLDVLTRSCGQVGVKVVRV